MSKRAIEKAYEKYPLSMERTDENLERNAKRLGYWIGYEQAEKDLTLTWEDIEKITDIHRNVLYDNPKRIMGAKENYEDTLKKFNEWREENRATKK